MCRKYKFWFVEYSLCILNFFHTIIDQRQFIYNHQTLFLHIFILKKTLGGTYLWNLLASNVFVLIQLFSIDTKYLFTIYFLPFSGIPVIIVWRPKVWRGKRTSIVQNVSWYSNYCYQCTHSFYGLYLLVCLFIDLQEFVIFLFTPGQHGKTQMWICVPQIMTAITVTSKPDF